MIDAICISIVKIFGTLGIVAICLLMAADAKDRIVDWFAERKAKARKEKANGGDVRVP